MKRKSYLNFLRYHFALEWIGIHGSPHWARGRANGLLLAEQTRADPKVVEVFAYIHDAERRNEGSDPDHGPRAALLAEQVNREFLQLSSRQLRLLMAACEGHSRGGYKGDITVITCWDADRLDLAHRG